MALDRRAAAALLCGSVLRASPADTAVRRSRGGVDDAGGA